MKVIISIIPPESHRYCTCGDWALNPDGDLEIRVSEMGNLTYSLMIAIHELAEWIVCNHTGVTEGTVDHWDMVWCRNSDDPGDEPGCPYAQGHSTGVAIERLLCATLNIPWSVYDKVVCAAVPPEIDCS